MRTDHASASARSAARAAFLASWRAVSARIFALMIRPPHMTSRVLVLMDGNYSFPEAREQSTRPSCLSGLCRFTLVKRFVSFLPAVNWECATMPRCCLLVTHALLNKR
jgi:hypothetical protein